MELSFGNILVMIAVCWNIITFIMMGADKSKARRDKWRIPERTLMLSSFCFGCVGILGGMYVFHHKTKHPKFYIGVPLSLLIDAAAVAAAVYFL